MSIKEFIGAVVIGIIFSAPFLIETAKSVL